MNSVEYISNQEDKRSIKKKSPDKGKKESNPSENINR